MVRLALATLAVAAVAACATNKPTMPAVPQVDLPRFMGTWHVVAHIPYFAERGHVAARRSCMQTLVGRCFGRRGRHLGDGRCRAGQRRQQCEYKVPVLHGASNGMRCQSG